ncbi:MAG: hypothetical protein M1825_004857 [Sarcosagium campestre]|nr:MAG: hypothetical protein M1825_004857 [Sarcosagium campestre]
MCTRTKSINFMTQLQAGSRYYLRNTNRSPPTPATGQKRLQSEERSNNPSKRPKKTTSEKGKSDSDTVEEKLGNTTDDRRRTKGRDIEFWVEHDANWPDDFAEKRLIASSTTASKRPRTASASQSGEDQTPRNWIRPRKDGGVPEQYTAAYEQHIFTKGLDMDLFKGLKAISKQSERFSKGLLKIKKKVIGPALFPQNAILEVLRSCQTRNEACSVAVRALLRIEQEADKYRSIKGFEKLNGEALVYSISHDQEDARLHGHYAIVEGEKWIYYRYCIKKFDLLDLKDLLAAFNFLQNLLETYVPVLVKRLHDALEALPEPSTVALSAPEMALRYMSPVGQSQRYSESFRILGRPASSMNSRLVRQLEKQLEQQQQRFEQQQK